MIHIRGIVKFYKVREGYGFIIGEDNKEYFVHEKQLFLLPYLEKGDIVEFENCIPLSGPKAFNVRKIESKSQSAP